GRARPRGTYRRSREGRRHRVGRARDARAAHHARAGRALRHRGQAGEIGLGGPMARWPILPMIWLVALVWLGLWLADRPKIRSRLPFLYAGIGFASTTPLLLLGWWWLFESYFYRGLGGTHLVGAVDPRLGIALRKTELATITATLVSGSACS